MQNMKVLAQFYNPLTPCAKIFLVIEDFAPLHLKNDER